MRGLKRADMLAAMKAVKTVVLWEIMRGVMWADWMVELMAALRAASMAVRLAA